MGAVNSKTAGAYAVQRFMTSSTAVAMVLLVLALTRFAEAQSYQVMSSAPSVIPALGKAQLVVLSATRSEKEMLLRVGVFNGGETALIASDELRSSAITLTTFVNGKRTEMQPSTTTLDTITPNDGLAPKAMHTGLMAFRFVGKMQDLGSLELRVPMFRAVFFTLDEAKKFDPIDWKTAAQKSVIDCDLLASAEQLAIIPMRLKCMTIRDDALEIDMDFRNASRFEITWKGGGLNGNSAVLITEHGDTLRPQKTSISLSQSDKAKSQRWAANEVHDGWLRFPLPDPDAAHELRFIFPGYPGVLLRYDKDHKHWEAAVRAVAADDTATRVDAVLNEERTFAEVKAYWDNMTDLIRKRKYEEMLPELRGTARKLIQDSLDQWQSIPFSSFEYDITEFQRVKPDADGRLHGVKVDLRYTLASLPKHNEFLTRMKCEMRRLEDKTWVVDAIDFAAHPPFWLLGYSHVEQSEHFMVFHRVLPDGEKPIALALKQLEKSYTRLTKTGLPLESRYAAFIVAVRDDFEKLTQRNPLTYSGAASSGYSTKNGKVTVINQALYINDYRFYALQRMWGKQDRQITMHHELVHLALADLTRPWTPPWLTEGTAMYYADQCDSFSRAALRQNLTPTITLENLSKLSSLGVDTDNASRITTEYLLSGEAVMWLEKQYGEAGLLKFYAAFAKETPKEWQTYDGQSTKLLAAAQLRIAKRILAETFNGLTLEQLDATVRKVVGVKR